MRHDAIDMVLLGGVRVVIYRRVCVTWYAVHLDISISSLDIFVLRVVKISPIALRKIPIQHPPDSSLFHFWF